MSDRAAAYAAAREALLARILQALSADDRFIAAWLGGSFGRGEADAYSDLDLAVVVSDQCAKTLCARPWQVGSQATPDRLALFGQFGEPAAIHENHNNAPEGGTMTFVLYAGSALVVDWTLIPQGRALRPHDTHLLFDHAGVPALEPKPAPPPEARAAHATERLAFFWMMAAVTAKYIARGEAVSVHIFLNVLHHVEAEIEQVLTGVPASYRRRSPMPLAPTRDAQAEALRQLCNRILKRMPEVERLGGQVAAAPMAEVEALLALA